MKELFIIGAGQLGQLLYKEIKKINNFKVIGFIDKFTKKNSFDGVKIYKNEIIFLKSKKKLNFVLALGNINFRKKIFKKFQKKKNFFFPKIILDHCYIENKKNIGNGTIIMTHSKILNNSKISSNCLIGTNVNILHDTKVGKNCVVGGNTCIGANTEIGENVLIGVGTIISSSKKKIGSDSIICAGSVIHKDIKKNSKVIGNPIKYIPKKN
jgi:sugar O-acyltransferase (sialic acid O-acetyltransferase NeuD family)